MSIMGFIKKQRENIQSYKSAKMNIEQKERIKQLEKESIRTQQLRQNQEKINALSKTVNENKEVMPPTKLQNFSKNIATVVNKGKKHLQEVKKNKNKKTGHNSGFSNINSPTRNIFATGNRSPFGQDSRNHSPFSTTPRQIQRTASRKQRGTTIIIR